MPIGDEILAAIKDAAGGRLPSASTLESIRLRMNNLESLSGLATKVSGESGVIRDLSAGGVELSNGGVQLIQSSAAAPDNTAAVRFLNRANRAQCLGSVGTYYSGDANYLTLYAEDIDGKGDFGSATVVLDATTKANSSAETFYSEIFATVLNAAQPSSYIPFDFWTGKVGGDQDRLLAFEWNYATRTGSLIPPGAAKLNLGTASDYWNDVSYKTLTDRGCLGSFDGGVEMQDGRVLSDVAALRAIRVSDKEMTVYGVPRLDYKTMPRAVYKPAGEGGGADGAETTALISILIGAVKELADRIDKLEPPK